MPRVPVRLLVPVVLTAIIQKVLLFLGHSCLLAHRSGPKAHHVDTEAAAATHHHVHERVPKHVHRVVAAAIIVRVVAFRTLSVRELLSCLIEAEDVVLVTNSHDFPKY